MRFLILLLVLNLALGLPIRPRFRAKLTARDYNSAKDAFAQNLVSYLAKYTELPLKGEPLTTADAYVKDAPLKDLTFLGHVNGVIAFLAAQKEALMEANGGALHATVTDLIASSLLLKTKLLVLEARVCEVPFVHATELPVTPLIDALATKVKDQQMNFDVLYRAVENYVTANGIKKLLSLGNSPMWLAYTYKYRSSLGKDIGGAGVQWLPFSESLGTIPMKEGSDLLKETDGDGALVFNGALPEVDSAEVVFMRDLLENKCHLSPKDITQKTLLMEYTLSGGGLMSFLSFMEVWAEEQEVLEAFKANTHLIIFSELDNDLSAYDETMPYDIFGKFKPELNMKGAETAYERLKGLEEAPVDNDLDARVWNYMHEMMRSPDINNEAMLKWFRNRGYTIHQVKMNADQTHAFSDFLKIESYYLGFKFPKAKWNQVAYEATDLGEETHRAAAAVETWYDA
jgi:hypothetical protein